MKRIQNQTRWKLQDINVEIKIKIKIELLRNTIEVPVRDVAIGSGIPISFCKPKINYVNLKRTEQLHIYGT